VYDPFLMGCLRELASLFIKVTIEIKNFFLKYMFAYENFKIFPFFGNFEFLVKIQNLYQYPN
jgi:hypothetical protein